MNLTNRREKCTNVSIEVCLSCNIYEAHIVTSCEAHEQENSGKQWSPLKVQTEPLCMTVCSSVLFSSAPYFVCTFHPPTIKKRKKNKWQKKQQSNVPGMKTGDLGWAWLNTSSGCQSAKNKTQQPAKGQIILGKVRQKAGDRRETERGNCSESCLLVKSYTCTQSMSKRSPNVCLFCAQS